jgi:hypothetical protein
MKYPKVKHLYKYYAYNEHSLSVLINKKIWVAKPGSFNDPFDSDINFEDGIEDKTIELISRGKAIVSKEFKKGFLKTLNMLKDTRFRKAGIFSMSKNNDNILMWYHYANEHKGFCIEFIRESDNNLGNSKMTRPMDYPKDRDRRKISHLTHNINNDLYDSIFYIKARDWEYEAEWRCVYGEGDRDEPIPSAISSIIFGLEMPQKHRDAIKNILSGQGISYKEAVKVDNQFKIDIIDLPE